MRKMFRSITLCTVIFACCLACSYSFAAGGKLPEYTIVLYLNGCDLENKINSAGNPQAEATKALNALINSSFNDSKLNVLVITGGTKKWIMEYPKISTTQCQAWRIWGESKKKMELVADTEPVAKMMDKDTLANYIEWAIKNYPAKKYILIMWDHGGGPIGGFGTDELDNGVSISISDINYALQKSLGGRKLELLIFACCLMGNFETAYKVKDYANYMVGSEELGYGDAFESLIENLNNDPSISGKKLGKLFIDGHFDINYQDGRNGMYTFSLIDLSKMNQIKNNWDSMIRQLSDNMKGKSKSSADMYRYLAIARAFSESYNEFTREFNGITDMYRFAELISERCKINTDVRGKYTDGPVVTFDSDSITKTCLENGEYAGAFYLEGIVGRKIWSYYKVFKVNSSLEVKETEEDGEAPMPENETL